MGLDNYKTDRCFLKSLNGIEYYSIDGLEQVQNEMLRLLRIVDQICVENGIQYWVDGGTLIGTVRHQGFIPWDDDIDISLTKKDYLKLLPLLEDYSKVNKDTYLYFSSQELMFHCCNFFASKKNLYARGKKSFNLVPIKLDIRPVNVFLEIDFKIEDNNRLRDKANYYIFHKSYFPETACCKASNINIFLEEKANFLNWYNREYGNIDAIPGTVFSHPYFEFSKPLIFKFSDVFPIKKMKFENIEVSVPNNTANFLSLIPQHYNLTLFISS